MLVKVDLAGGRKCLAILVASQAASTSCCFHAIRGFLGGFFAEELKELAGVTHGLESETGGAEEQAYSAV